MIDPLILAALVLYLRGLDPQRRALRITALATLALVAACDILGRTQ